MQKDFDSWNKIKKGVNEQILPKEFFFREREIWWCSLGVNIGIETDGKSDLFERPVLILKVFNSEMIWVMPITSVVKTAAFRYSFIFNNIKQSVVITQLRTISAKRLRRKIGTISELDFDNILRKLREII